MNRQTDAKLQEQLARDASAESSHSTSIAFIDPRGDRWIDRAKAPAEVASAARGLEHALRKRPLGALLDDEAGLSRALEAASAVNLQASCGKDLLLWRGITSSAHLYYRVQDDGVSWSMNPRELLTHAGAAAARRELLPALLAGEVVRPDLSCYATLTRLPAGCALLRHGGRVRTVRLSDFRARDDFRSMEEAAHLLVELITAAVRRCLPIHGRVAVLLSGGIDSAVVALSAVRTGADVVGVHWSKRAIPEADETEFAVEVANRVGARLLTIDVTSAEADARHLKPQLTPVAAAHPYQAWYDELWRCVHAAGRDTVLSGRLGDNIFGMSMRRARFALSPGLTLRGLCEWLATPLPTRAIFSDPVSQVNEFGLHARTLLTPEGQKWFAELGGYTFPSANWRPDQQRMYHEVHSVLSREVDVAVTANARVNGVVLASPFLDRDLIEFGLGLPSSQRAMVAVGRIYDKPLLRLAFAGALPADVVRRNAGPWVLGVCARYVRANADLVQQLLGPKALLSDLGVVDHRAVVAALDAVAREPRFSVPLINAVMVERWLRDLENLQGDL